MAVFWTEEALDDLEEILAYYYLEAGPATAEAVERRIMSQVEGLEPLPERIGRATGFPARGNSSSAARRTSRS